MKEDRSNTTILTYSNYATSKLNKYNNTKDSLNREMSEWLERVNTILSRMQLLSLNSAHDNEVINMKYEIKKLRKGLDNIVENKLHNQDLSLKTKIQNDSFRNITCKCNTQENIMTYKNNIKAAESESKYFNTIAESAKYIKIC